MNTPNIVFTNGAVLTANGNVNPAFAVLTGHQITSQDFATQFVFGIDIDLDGASLQAARSVNGTVADARYFGDGDNSDAIQRAIDWVAATAEGEGIVYVAALAGQWDIDQTINVFSGIRVLIDPNASLALNFNGYAFTLASGAIDVEISGARLDGNQRAAGGLVDSVGASFNTTIRNCWMGDPGSASTTFVNGYLFHGHTSAHARLTIEDCRVAGGGGIVTMLPATSTNGVRILRNKHESTIAGNHSNAAVSIELQNCPFVEVIGNQLEVGTAAAGPATAPDRSLKLTSCNDAKVRDNYCNGGRLSGVYLTACLRAQVRGNTFLNGGNGGGGAPEDSVMRIDGSDGSVIQDNLISGLESTIATLGVPAFALRSAGVTTDPMIVKDNTFRLCDDAAGGTGFYMVSNITTLSLAAGSAVRRGNRYATGQNGTVTIAGGAASEIKTALGISASMPWTDANLQGELTGAAAQALVLDAIGTDQFTVRAAGGAALVNQLCYYSFDG